METADIQRRWLKFFEERDHTVVPSASLVSDDPTLMFTVAGMVPFIPFLTGVVPAPYARATSVQKCIRTLDIESFNHGSATRKVIAIFNELGLGEDLQRARDGRKVRAGKATMRGRVHKTPKSVLLVVKEKSGLAQAARNLPGVDVVAAKDLNAEDLAPGGDVGRLTVFTKSALEELN